jgi:hypothetical protein
LTSILRFKLTEFQKIYPRLVVIPDIYTKDVPPKDAHQLAGADFLLNGEVYSFEPDVQVSFHLINAETRQEVYSDRIVTASLGQVDLQMALLRKILESIKLMRPMENAGRALVRQAAPRRKLRQKWMLWDETWFVARTERRIIWLTESYRLSTNQEVKPLYR